MPRVDCVSPQHLLVLRKKSYHIISGGEIDDEILAAIDRIGHTSGWDVVAGLVVVLETWAGVLVNASTNRIN